MNLHRLAEIVAEHERGEYGKRAETQRLLQGLPSSTCGSSDIQSDGWNEDSRIPRFPKSTARRYDDFEILGADSALILGDSEIPDHDSRLFDLAAEMAMREKIKTLIIAGDFVALDSFSTWKRNTGTIYSFQQELAPAIESLRLFMGIFDRIVYITGNHERRIANQTDGNIILGYFLEGLDRVSFSEYAYCILNSGKEKFLVCHPDNYSRKPTSVPQGLAITYNMHVIAGHTHRQTFSISPNGLHYCIETGHCRDVQRTQYKALRINLHPEWTTGFVVVFDGVPFLVNQNNYKHIRR